MLDCLLASHLDDSLLQQHLMQSADFLTPNNGHRLQLLTRALHILLRSTLTT